MQKSDPLIRTKLRPPFTRSGLVARPRLQEQLAQGLSGPLTLVIAPAGFGKTTLVAAGIAGFRMPVAWLSLDSSDNQPERFLSYLVAALQGAVRAVGGDAAQLLSASQRVLPEAILSRLVNDLDAAGSESALVLDDYHAISNPEIHAAVTFFLEHCPRTFHLLIASRSDPPLPLARWRARGQAVELRAADLRFSEPEAAEFLNDVMGLHLDSAAVAVLAERTEGWIAGLQMASIAVQARLGQSPLSMRDREDISGFIQGFSGTNRYILDYLLEEVLASQPAEIQHFLLFTSILERLTAPLCEAILGDQGIGVRGAGEWGFAPIPYPLSPGSDCQAVLEHLERANLFLVPLDDARQWYRYHNLFAGLLRTQLQETLGSQGVARLHLRASEWYEENGFILDAIHHASIASDFTRIERLIEQNYIEMANHGEMSSIRFWMGKLSKEAVTQRPWLCLYEAMSRSWFGQLDEADEWLQKAENRIRSGLSAPDTQSMLAYHAYIQSRVTAMRGDTLRAISLCRTAVGVLPEENLGLQIDFRITLGYEYFLYGDFANASVVLQEMIQSGAGARAINNPVAGYAVLARMQGYQGRLHEAHDLLRKAAQLVHDASGQHLGVNGLVAVELAALSCEWNDLEAALRRLKQGLDFLPLWGKADDLCLAYVTLARIHLALGNKPQAAGAVDKAAHLVETCGTFSEARNAVEASQVKIWLAQGDWPAIDRWVAALEKKLAPQDPPRYEDELPQITLARVWIAQGNPGKVTDLLSPLETSARTAGRAGRLVEILLLKALVLHAAGDAGSALQALSQCLALAEPEGYVRLFLDEGPPAQLLLAQWLALASPGLLRDYAVRLLSHFEAARGALTAAQGQSALPGDRPASPVQALVEPLSPRELEVLQLIALGSTNQEIARELVISPGTVKAHTASIYRKLDAANRTDAVGKARRLGIIS